jgi:hypothetical protein
VALIAKVMQRVRQLVPAAGFHFDRPLVLFQSDDWGRCGTRDQGGLEQLRSAGIVFGERPYDFYSLETAQDLGALRAILKGHHDAAGRTPVLEMNFIVANLDFTRMSADDFQRIHVLPLAEGFPPGWNRPGLLEAYREGIADGVFRPALHGTTHFCRSAVEREMARDGERATLIRALWRAGTPYIHWRMPWIGYEYWDPENPEAEGFLTADQQLALIGQTVGGFAKLFSTLPRSACAPGYRANDDTHKAWASHGIRVVQNGPGAPLPPHFDRHEILHLSRTIEFEPATDRDFSLEACLQKAEKCFALGMPAIVSVHSINFHSTLADFRTRTLQLLDEFLSLLESKHADLLYSHDEDLYQWINQSRAKEPRTSGQPGVTRKRFSPGQFVWQWKW